MCALREHPLEHILNFTNAPDFYISATNGGSLSNFVVIPKILESPCPVCTHKNPGIPMPLATLGVMFMLHHVAGHTSGRRESTAQDDCKSTSGLAGGTRLENVLVLSRVVPLRPDKENVLETQLLDVASLHEEPTPNKGPHTGGCSGQKLCCMIYIYIYRNPHTILVDGSRL